LIGLAEDIMRAVAYTKSLPVSDPACFVEVELERPVPGPRDLLVKIEAVSVNPVDFKVRRRDDPGGKPKVIGYDAAGTVEAIGAEVKLFKSGDAVFYSGSITRPGTNSEYHLVDERIVGRKPRSLGFAEAAALPLTAMTAWELFFDRMGLGLGQGHAGSRSLLILGGAGGVGSAAIQIARALTGMTIIATASRPETVAWVKSLGAHYVIDHSKLLGEQLAAIGHPMVDAIAAFAGSKGHAATLLDLIAPQGRIGLIEGDALSDLTPADLAKLQPKCASLHFEFMFARPRFGTPDLIRQHEILDEIADLVDAGRIRSTIAKKLSPISASTLREAHALSESGKAIGKIVLEGWG
jgi:zinc-binding alcohol dehydrogenase family protein